MGLRLTLWLLHDLSDVGSLRVLYNYVATVLVQTLYYAQKNNFIMVTMTLFFYLVLLFSIIQSANIVHIVVHYTCMQKNILKNTQNTQKHAILTFLT